MGLSYEGIGQWAATFECAAVGEGEVVRISDSQMVGPCAKGDGFCGMVLSLSRGGDACSVALGGMVSAGYTGDAPALGWSGLSSDGSGGVQADGAGRVHLVVDVDSTAKIVTFVL